MNDVRESLFPFFFPQSYEMVISLAGMSKAWNRKKKIQNLNAGALLTPPETPGVVQKGLCSAISFLSTPTQPAPLGPYEFLSDAPSGASLEANKPWSEHYIHP